jgi:DMSO/TMAO reductase YedYZ molybdopterin-dependent catalytic subunit
VRWHLANIPTKIDGAAFRLNVRGQVERTLSLSLTDLRTKFEPVELAAVNQCSGNSRGFYDPRVAGAQWGNGAMGNALWTGVRLRDILDRAGLKGSAVQARFNGLDEGILPATPDFIKSLDIDHARDGEVMIAYAMNGQPLPLLNGFPLRLVVPGWYSTYWVKMLNDIEVLDHPDDNFWMSKAYLIPDTPQANITPGQTGVKMVPINRMVPRSFFTNLTNDQNVAAGKPQTVRGIAFGGDAGVRDVSVSSDGGATWVSARLGHDHGKYSFRQWETHLIPKAGPMVLKIKATNTAGAVQPDAANWNTAGFMRNVVESITLMAS